MDTGTVGAQVCQSPRALKTSGVHWGPEVVGPSDSRHKSSPSRGIPPLDWSPYKTLTSPRTVICTGDDTAV